MCLLSIIIPNFNNGKFLPRCLNSILISGRKDFEVIVIDDGSTDGSTSYLSGVADERTSCFFQENKGVSAARNVGIENAKGKYVTFCDSDDYYDEGGIDRLLGLLETHVPDRGLFVFDACIEETRVDGTKTRKKWGQGLPGTRSDGHIDCGAVVKFLCGNSTANSAINKVYDNTLLNAEGIRFPEGITIGEDGIFNLEYAAKCSEAIAVQDMIYVFCRAESEFSSFNLNVNPGVLKKLVEISKIREGVVKKYCKENGLDKKYAERLHFLLKESDMSSYYYWVKELNKKYGATKLRNYMRDNSEIRKIVRRYFWVLRGHFSSPKRLAQAAILFLWGI